MMLICIIIEMYADVFVVRYHQTSSLVCGGGSQIKLIMNTTNQKAAEIKLIRKATAQMKQAEIFRIIDSHVYK